MDVFTGVVGARKLVTSEAVRPVGRRVPRFFLAKADQ